MFTSIKPYNRLILQTTNEYESIKNNHHQQNLLIPFKLLVYQKTNNTMF